MNKTALTKTYTKDIQNSCLNSKKIVLSLATISFLASCANAKLNSEIKTYEQTNRHTKARSATSVYSSQSGTSTSINTSQTDTHTVNGSNNTLVIESGGTITISNNNRKQAVNFTQGSSTTTFLNQGTLIGGNNTASVNLGTDKKNGVTIETFDNQGIIGNSSSRFGITVWGNSSKSSITNFTNSGTIHSNTGESIYFSNVNISSFANSGTIKSNRGKGVNIVGGASIENFSNSRTINGAYGVFLGSNSEVVTFTNNGTISGTTHGVSFDPKSKATTFTNSGTISGNSSGIFVLGGNIQTLKNSGTIISNGRGTSDAGIKLENNGSIKNIINTGTIRSNYTGIVVTYGKFGTLTIKDGGVVYGRYIGIGVGQWQTLGDLYIDGKNTSKNGAVSRIYSDNFGISLETGSNAQKIELTNGGVIRGNNSGIRLIKSASLSGEMILSGEGSRVEGGRGAGISNSNGKIEGSITVKDGATVTATSGQAISNSGSGSITGGITVSGENTKLEGNIINTGNASIGSDIKIEGGAKVEGGLVNQGSGTISGSITVDKNSKLDSITNTSTSDTGISGSITNNSDNKLQISNSGNIGGKIESTGAADMVINNNGSGTISGGISSSGSGNTSISNSQGATINNGITVSGSAQVGISNQGSVGGSITNNSDNKLEISNSGNIGGKIEST
ncbi:beta strand repeat-containing protein, partial [Campylobacter jejuni]|uniref:beta strand repeat-containing protein n=1 Tax=Campylobacter jejuni TaxID=197 RepID=UPI001003B504